MGGHQEEEYKELTKVKKSMKEEGMVSRCSKHRVSTFESEGDWSSEGQAGSRANRNDGP